MKLNLKLNLRIATLVFLSFHQLIAGYDVRYKITELLLDEIKSGS